MRSIGAVAVSDEAGQLHPTAAGILMFGDDEGWEEPIIEERFDPDRTVIAGQEKVSELTIASAKL